MVALEIKQVVMGSPRHHPRRIPRPRTPPPRYSKKNKTQQLFYPLWSFLSHMANWHLVKDASSRERSE